MNGAMYLIYKAELSIFEQYRINPLQSWPWESDPKKWTELKNTTLELFLTNSVLMIVVSVVYFKLFNFASFWDMSNEGLINSWTERLVKMIPQIYFCMICEDSYYYAAHRVAHWRVFYRFHKVHHRFNINVSIASECIHPFDFIFVSLISVAVGPLILGKQLHFYTWLIYFSLRTIESVDSHCGYEFPWSLIKSLPLQIPASFHDWHHSANIGNYSAWFCHWDIFFGTEKGYYTRHEKTSLSNNTSPIKGIMPSPRQ